MNTIILLIGLILIIVAIIIILLSRKTHVDEDYMTNDVNDISHVFKESEREFEKIINDFNVHDDNNEFVFNDEKKLPNLANMTLENMNIETKDDNDINYKEELEGEPQKNNYDRIIELSKSGLRTEEIAKIIGKGIREVEITLKLHNKKKN